MQRFSYSVKNTHAAVLLDKARRVFPELMDDHRSLRFPIKTPKSEENELHYVRARVNTEKHLAMLEVWLERDELRFVQVPGVHDITGSFTDFLQACYRGFVGGPLCNVVLLGVEPVPRFNEFEYNQSHSASQEWIKGDRYRVLLWSGFSRNYYPWASGKYGYATVERCPPQDIEPFVVLARGLDDVNVSERIAFYRSEFERLGMLCPVFLRRETYQPVVTG